MIVEAQGLRCHAALVSRRQLYQARGRLKVLRPGEQRAVEELARGLAEAIAAELLDQAERDRRLAAALAASYR